MADAFNHLFFLGELQSRSCHSTQQGQSSAVPSAWQISAPFLPGVIKTLGHSWLLLAAEQPPREGQLQSLCLALNTARHSPKPEHPSQEHGLAGKGSWSWSRSTPSMGRRIFH